MARRLTCPYCYESFAPREIRFRCNSRLSRTGKQCSRRRDQVLDERRGPRPSHDLGPDFAADGRKPTAPCPDCDGESTYRICPVCHSELPVQFGRVDNRLIAMVGAKASGKTVYMTVLLHEMRNRVGEAFGAALMGLDDATMRRYSSDYEDRLYRDNQMFPGTQTASTNLNRVDPLVFRFSLGRRTLLGERPQHTVLSFFDTAGEDFSSRESVELNTRYLTGADGIILLLDPLQMSDARAGALPGTPLPGTEGLDAPVNVLSRVTSLLLAPRSGRSSQKIDTPIAVVFSKMDAFWHQLDAGSPLRDYAPPGGRFDVSDSLSVHEEVRRLLKDWDGVQIDQLLDNHYTRYRYFGVSALGRNPTPEARVAPTGIQPYRVADPLLWLLAEFGSVPKAGRG
ncbi:TRAFAC clade GTPase domain-containing protein [Streptomyces flaveolus]|uniref:TRAFAC clade GTPase domain-containing protein n=1 Tax=Streptomyces flaveolus TaxID=67297 RepID=UPI0033F3D244